MLTERCNLHCPYCFASEYTNHPCHEISMQNFVHAVQFVMKDDSKTKLGIIGGEPTLYSHFAEVLDYLEKEDKVRHAVIFTNGILLSRFLNHVVSDKLVFLINCNSPQDIGLANFKHMEESIDTLVNQKNMRNNTMLGLNIYRDDMNISFYIDLLKKYQFRYARISVVVPSDMEKYSGPFDYFTQMKPILMRVFHEMADIGVLPNYDCNRIPLCMWTESEREQIRNLFGQRMCHSNILSDTVKCSPTIDIDTDLQVIRCFGFSDGPKISLESCKDVSSLKQFFIEKVDQKYKRDTCDRSFSCNFSSNCVKECYGGCLAFRTIG